FQFSPSRLSIDYQDNGRGFDRPAYEQKKERTSFGLKNMENRIAFLDGNLTFETAPSQGVTVHINFPLSPASETQSDENTHTPRPGR
ncbi:MAG: hypothetical protein KDC44_04650, partial [Phaeodactylibacter sp.]|nr:hypothetical protein [Phaeodactylibacter sp.]